MQYFQYYSFMQLQFGVYNHFLADAMIVDAELRLHETSIENIAFDLY